MHTSKPFIEKLNTQSKNGLYWYTYVLNNPLKYTDPTGYIKQNPTPYIEPLRRGGGSGMGINGRPYGWGGVLGYSQNGMHGSGGFGDDGSAGPSGNSISGFYDSGAYLFMKPGVWDKLYRAGVKYISYNETRVGYSPLGKMLRSTFNIKKNAKVTVEPLFNIHILDQAGVAPDMIDWSKGGRTQQILDWVKHIEAAHKDPNFTYPADPYSAYKISDVVKRQGTTTAGNMGPNWKKETYLGKKVEVYYLQKSSDFIEGVGENELLMKINQYVIYMKGPQCGNCPQPRGLMGIHFSSYSQFNNAWRYIYGTDYNP